MTELLDGHVLVISVFLFHLLGIFEGLDVEDSGFQLAHQMALLSRETPV